MGKSYNKHWPKKNLGEIVNFIEKQFPQGLYISVIAKKLDKTPQYISGLFNKDDMKLSKAEEIADIFGYRLRLYFPVKEYPWGMQAPEPKRPFPNAGNLTGLVRYLSDSNITVNNMSKRIGKSNSVLTDAFNKGDILISTLYLIINNLDIEVIWIFEEKK
jgi:hypothetical protein